MHTRALALVVASIALAGVRFGSAAPTVTLSDRILVSPAGHRIGEFNVARDPSDPNHLVVGGMDWDDPSGNVGCNAFVSRDGGRSWHQGGRIPNLDEPYTRGDPYVAVDGLGRAHMQCLKFVGKPAEYAVGTVIGDGTGRPTILQMHARSDNGGDTWNAAARVPPRTSTNQVDKGAMYAASNGTLYACMNDYPVPGDDLTISRSFDGGDSWSTPAALDRLIGIDTDDASSFGNCAGFAEGPHGEVYLAWTASFPDGTVRFGTVASFDGGDTWTNPAPIAVWSQASDRPTSTAEALLLNPGLSVASIAVDPINGAIFVTAPQYDTASDRFDVALYRSTDLGKSYSPVALPAIPSRGCDACHETRPSVTVDDRGRLALELVLTSQGGLIRETWFLVNDGITWLSPIQLSATDGTQSYANPENWMPSSDQMTSQLDWTLRHPDRADVAYGWEGVARVERTDHIRWGGDYWGITSTPEGFVALGEDHLTGRRALYARIVEVQ